MQLSELTGGPKPLPVTFPNGAVLNVVYDPNAVTADVVTEMATATDGNAPVKAACKLLTGWDLEDKAGPILVGVGHEADVAARVNLVVLGIVLSAIVADFTVDPRKPAS